MCFHGVALWSSPNHTPIKHVQVLNEKEYHTTTSYLTWCHVSILVCGDEVQALGCFTLRWTSDQSRVLAQDMVIWGLVYIVDPEVVPWPSKSVDWLSNSSPDNFSYSKEKMSEGPWRSRSPKYNFKILMNALTWPNGFCNWERQERWYGRKRQGPMAEKCHFTKFLMIFF